jgi:hypothetical protein
MTISTRRNLLSGALAATALTPFAAYAQRQIDGRHAVIEIGSSGVKATALRFDREAVLEPPEAGSPMADGQSRAERYRANTLASFTDDPVVRDPAQIGQAVDAVAQAVRLMRGAPADVPRENIQIVGSSSVAALNHRPELEQALARRNLTVNFVSAADEAELTFRWIVLPHRWMQAALVDVGSGNTKGGYINNTGAFTTFRPFEIPFGSRGLAERATAATSSLTPETWDQALVAAGREVVEPAFRHAANVNPGLVSRPRMYLAGGAAWALATFMHPEASVTEPNWVRLNRRDITAFRDLVFANPDAAVEQRLTRIVDPQTRQDAQSLVANVRERIAPQQMKAGAEIMALAARHFNIPQKEAIFFSKEALYAWPTMYLLRTLGLER